MALPRYKQCCMCTNVRTGAIILAIIGILGHGFCIISYSVGLGNYAQMIEDRNEHEKNASMSETKYLKQEGVIPMSAEKEGSRIDEEYNAKYQAYWQNLDFITWFFIVQIIISVSNLLVNGCMLFGVTKKKPGFILPWLIIFVASIVLTVALLSLELFVWCIWTPGIGIFSKVMFVLFMSLGVGLMMYFWLVVRSVYLDIRETKVTKPVGVDHEAQIEKAGGKYMKM
jgi:hypothetical protein